VVIPSSSVAHPGEAGVKARTNIQLFVPAAGFGPKLGTTGPPFPGFFYQTPASLACIYHFNPPTPVDPPGCNPYAALANPTGGSRAIAIVDAFDNPTAYQDLAIFSAQFGVAQPTPATFQVVYAPPGSTSVPGQCIGSATQPPVDPTGGWEIEESLDVQWAHAMAPHAVVYLVEAQSNFDNDLFCAVSLGSSLVAAAGGGQVSMSWGGGEFPQESLFDGLFTTPGVVYFASSGDGPGVIWPSASPNVVAAGGTTISMNPVSGAYISETAWSETGGGRSLFEPPPSYQAGLHATTRQVPDIASVANPDTGVWVFYNGFWYIVGGTSVSAPTWAGIVNAAGSFATSSAAELTKLYTDPSNDFHDITSGVCGPYAGYTAAGGYDLCTGLGSPNNRTGK
jgi:subtilase family serine protease